MNLWKCMLKRTLYALYAIICVGGGIAGMLSAWYVYTTL